MSGFLATVLLLLSVGILEGALGPRGAQLRALLALVALAPFIVYLVAGADRRTGRAMLFLPTDRPVVIKGTLKTSMLPEELKDGLKGISKLAENLNELLAPARPAGQGKAATQCARTRPATQQGLKGTIAKLNKALDALNEVLSKKNRANLAASLKNVDDLTRKLLGSAEKLSSALDGINRTVTKIEAGEGSVGKFINDPKLYNTLLEASQQLSLSLKEFRQLLKQWKEKGVGIKLK